MTWLLARLKLTKLSKGCYPSFFKSATGKMVLLLITIMFSCKPLLQTGNRAYYVYSVSGVDNGNGSIAATWKNLSLINNYAFKPGDTIYFENGFKWIGGFEIIASGINRIPIVLATYGKGDKPLFSNLDSTFFNDNTIRISANYTVEDGLYFGGLRRR